MWILHGVLEHIAESESLSNSSQDREEGLNFEILRHKAELKEDKEGDAWFQVWVPFSCLNAFVEIVTTLRAGCITLLTQKIKSKRHVYVSGN